MRDKVYDIIERVTWKHLAVALLLAFTASSMYSNYKLLDVSSTTNNTAEQTRDSVHTLSNLAKNNTQLNKNNARSLEILEKATSPEAQAESDARLAGAIKQLSCDQQLTIQKAVELEFPDSNVMSAACIQYFVDNPPAE